MAFNVSGPATTGALGAGAGFAVGGPLGGLVGGAVGGIAGLVQEATKGYDPYKDPNFAPGVLPGANTGISQGVNPFVWDAMSPQEKLAYLTGVGSDLQGMGEYATKRAGENAANLQGYTLDARELVNAFGERDPMQEYWDLAKARTAALQPGVDLMRQAAMGSTPSAAELLMKQGLEQALNNQLSAAAANRGMSVGAMSPVLANSAVDATLSANQQAAVLRAQEMEAARAQWMQALLAQEAVLQNYMNTGVQDTAGKRADYLTQMGMESQKQQFNAGQMLDMFKTGSSTLGQVASAAGSAVKGGAGGISI